MSQSPIYVSHYILKKKWNWPKFFFMYKHYGTSFLFNTRWKSPEAYKLQCDPLKLVFWSLRHSKMPIFLLFWSIMTNISKNTAPMIGKPIWFCQSFKCHMYLVIEKLILSSRGKITDMVSWIAVIYIYIYIYIYIKYVSTITPFKI